MKISKWLAYLRPVLEIYTDGSEKSGQGAWAYVIVWKSRIIAEASRGVKKTDSLSMEIQAAIEALKSLSHCRRVRLCSDNRILIDKMTKGSLDQTPESHRELFRTLLSLAETHFIEWKWVKSHSGHKYNELCDTLCAQARLSH